MENRDKVYLAKNKWITNYYYHITRDSWWGEKTKLKPRDNHEAWNRNSNEPNIKRICVAPTLSGCLAAFDLDCDVSDWHVYTPVRPVKAITPWDLFDREVTGEMWILRPMVFKKVLTLPYSLIKKLYKKDNPLTVGKYEKSRHTRYRNIIKQELNKIGIPDSPLTNKKFCAAVAKLDKSARLKI